MRVLQAVLIVLIVLVAFAAGRTYGKALEGGLWRQPKDEAFLVARVSAPDDIPNLPDATDVAKNFGGTLATPGQLREYVRAGGSATWPGVASDGAVYYVPGAAFSPKIYRFAVDRTATDGAQVGGAKRRPDMPGAGVWVYGRKPAVNTPESSAVVPFACNRWFQPA